MCNILHQTEKKLLLLIFADLKINVIKLRKFTLTITSDLFYDWKEKIKDYVQGFRGLKEISGDDYRPVM